MNPKAESARDRAQAFVDTHHVAMQLAPANVVAPLAIAFLEAAHRGAMDALADATRNIIDIIEHGGDKMAAGAGEALQAENARMREELAWYADEENYVDDACDSSPVSRDQGESARAAIAGVAVVQATERHPLQPVVVAPDGVHRFKENAIVRYLLDNGPIDMNHIARHGFTNEDREQFAQLIGYSVSGACDLEYVSNRVTDHGLSISKALAACNAPARPEPVPPDKACIKCGNYTSGTPYCSTRCARGEKR